MEGVEVGSGVGVEGQGRCAAVESGQQSTLLCALPLITKQAAFLLFLQPPLPLPQLSQPQHGASTLVHLRCAGGRLVGLGARHFNGKLGFAGLQEQLQVGAGLEGWVRCLQKGGQHMGSRRGVGICRLGFKTQRAAEGGGDTQAPGSCANPAAAAQVAFKSWAPCAPPPAHHSVDEDGEGCPPLLNELGGHLGTLYGRQ